MLGSGDIVAFGLACRADTPHDGNVWRTPTRLIYMLVDEDQASYRMVVCGSLWQHYCHPQALYAQMCALVCFVVGYLLPPLALIVGSRCWRCKSCGPMWRMRLAEGTPAWGRSVLNHFAGSFPVMYIACRPCPVPSIVSRQQHPQSVSRTPGLARLRRRRARGAEDVLTWVAHALRVHRGASSLGEIPFARPARRDIIDQTTLRVLMRHNALRHQA